MSRKKALEGLVKKAAFIPMDRRQVPEGTQIFGSRFVDQLNQSDHGIGKKSRMVAKIGLCKGCREDSDVSGNSSPFIANVAAPCGRINSRNANVHSRHHSMSKTILN